MYRRLLSAAATLIVVGFAAVQIWRAPPTVPDAGNVPPLTVESPGETPDAPPPDVQLLPGVTQTVHDAPLAATIIGRAAPATPPGPGFRHQWPAVQAIARFEGDAVLAAFDDAVNRFRVTVDGGSGPVVAVTRPGRALLRLTGLGPGPHEVRLEKLSESSASAGFGGFYLPAGGLALPPPDPLPRRIAFIGDSDTVGYANTSPGRDCSAEQVFVLTDTGQSFGPRVARHFGADPVLIARSGIGLVRNYDGAEPGVAMPALYPLALADDPAAAALPAPLPGIVVVGLGSNDFSTPLRAGEAWADAPALRRAFEAALLAFLRDLRRDNPAGLYLLLAFGEYGDDLVGPHRAALAAFQADGARADLVILPKLARTACHWHPSLADHALIADRLIAAIEAQPEPWGTAP